MIPLVVRSHFSLMWGACSPASIVAAAQRLGYTRLALTDTDNVHGLWSFLGACREYGLTPLVGAEVSDPRTGKRAVVLVENEQGWRNLSRMLTARHLERAFSLRTVLPPRASGLVVLSVHEDLLTYWRDCGVEVAAALPRRPCGRTFELRETARRLGIPAVAVPSSFFIDQKDYGLHRLIRAIDLNTTLSRLKPGETAPADAWLASEQEYARRFEVWPETLSASDALAERLSFTGPDFGVVIPPWSSSPASSPDEELRRRTYEGARRRYGDCLSARVVDRIEYELAVIRRMGFSSYFLVVEHIVKRSPRICGRGSGAASVVAYALGITNVCPIKFDLYFDRFLNPGRTDPPDIDVDFAWDERDEVLSSVLGEYRGHAAMVAQFVTFGPRMALREAAKVWGLPEAEIAQVCKRLPWFRRGPGIDDEDEEDLRLWIEGLPEAKAMDMGDPWRHALRFAARLLGLPRYLSLHPGGVVITPHPLEEYVPVQIAPKGVPVVQWDKDAVEEAGLVKIDLLGNRSLGVIRDAIANVRLNGHPFDESRWEPEEDRQTQELVARGETMGCFYIESPAMRLLQRKARRGDYRHVVIHSSIIRPAANRYIREYLRRLHGGQWRPVHPLLQGILDETYGIMVYQEDVSRAAIALAGFSPVEADGLRKVMSKKDRHRQLCDYYRRFVQGARERGVGDREIAAVWDMIRSFEGYSFCKPHSASYARVSFQAAYLKAHFPAEFMAAVISNQGGFYATRAYVSEARRLGLTVVPPDVHESEIRWYGKGAGLRVGWLSVKGLAASTAERIIEERRRRPFRDIADFLSRVRPAVDEARTLVFARAFDSLHPGEAAAALLWEVACWQRSLRDSRRTSGDLFGAAGEIAAPSVNRESRLERLRREFSVLGFLCDCHPMSLFADRLQGRGIVKAGELGGHVGRRVSVAGLLAAEKIVSTEKGEPMEFVTFEDETGLIETTFFPESFRRFSGILDQDRPFVLTGTVEEEFGAVTLTVDHAAPLGPIGSDRSSDRAVGPSPRSEKIPATRPDHASKRAGSYCTG